VDTKEAVVALGALAQDTRLAIFRRLVEAGPEGLSVGQIAAEVGVAGATLSFHLKELSRAGLLASRQAGRFIYYSADYAAMRSLLGFLSANCCRRPAARRAA
jgi:DNA-binding transcriptional ArsR family regulator